MSSMGRETHTYDLYEVKAAWIKQKSGRENRNSAITIFKWIKKKINAVDIFLTVE